MERISIPSIDEEGELIPLAGKGVDKIFHCTEIKLNGVKNRVTGNASF